MMRLVVFLVALVLAGCTSSDEVPLVSAGRTDDRPNIVVVMADDHAFQAISAYGSTLIDTPNIDRLAAEGVRFDRAFVGNSICSPSRATLLTGKHSHANGLRNNLQEFNGSQQTLQSLLRQGGYQTAVIGKWHLKSEPTGFDHWEVLPGQGEYYNPDFRTAGGIERRQGYVTRLVTDRALEWLSAERDRAKPFFLLYAHKAPHREWWPNPEHLAASKDRIFPEPPTLFDDYSGRGKPAREAEMRISDHMGLVHDNKIYPDNAEQLGYEPFEDWFLKNWDRQWNGHMDAEQRAALDAIYGPINEAFMTDPPEGDALTRWKFQRFMQDYLATIKAIDDELGRLLDGLEAMGLEEDTLIIYTSDQGFYLGEHGWFDKRFMYEESFRTPLLMRWPGRITRGEARRAMVQNIDFAPTLLSVAGLTVPSDMHGKSLVPLFRDDDPAFRDALYYHYYEYPGIHAVKRHYGVRTDRYKLIRFYHDVETWELYDLGRDPDELVNVYGDPVYADVRAWMQEVLDATQASYGDSPELAQALLASDLEQLSERRAASE